MADHSPETTQEVKDVRGLRSRFQQGAELWDTRTEAEKSLGFLVRRHESGDPINLEVSPLPSEPAEVRPRLWGERREASPSQVSLRLNLRDVDIDNMRWKVIAVPTKDPAKTHFLEVRRPLSSADGTSEREAIFVRPLSEEEARRIEQSQEFVDYRELVSDKTRKMLEGREVLRVLGAEPKEIEILPKRGR